MPKRQPPTPGAKRKRGGQPFPWTPELETRLLRHVASGETLISFAEIPGNPSTQVIYDQADGDQGFRERLSQARARQVEAWAEQIVTLADGVDTKDRAAVEKVKQQTAVRMWLMSRRNPAAYSERVISESHNVNVNLNANADVERMTPEERRAEAERLAQRLGLTVVTGGLGKRAAG